MCKIIEHDFGGTKFKYLGDLEYEEITSKVVARLIESLTTNTVLTMSINYYNSEQKCNVTETMTFNLK